MLQDWVTWEHDLNSNLGLLHFYDFVLVVNILV